MIGPKLDARSYAILILAVIGTLLGATLLAQQATPIQGGLTSTSDVAAASRDVAAATRDVAAATREVAASNAQIAEAIRQLATSVKDLRSALDKKDGSGPAESAAAPDGAGAPKPSEGVLEWNTPRN